MNDRYVSEIATLENELPRRGGEPTPESFTETECILIKETNASLRTLTIIAFSSEREIERTQPGQ